MDVPEPALPIVNIASAEELWAMKRASQGRDRLLVASGAVDPAAMLFLRPDRLIGMRLEWPSCALNEDSRVVGPLQSDEFS
jgi:hypothetical protein